MSAVFFIASNSSYFLGTLRGDAVPQRMTWFTLSLIALTNLATQIAAGATYSLAAHIASFVGITAVFILGISKGTGGTSKSDIFVLITCVVGLTAWIVVGNERLQIVANLVAGFFSMALTFAKTSESPNSENTPAWVFSSTGAALAALSVGRLDFDLIIIPAFWAVLHGALVVVILLGSRRHQESEESVTSVPPVKVQLDTQHQAETQQQPKPALTGLRL